MSEKLIAKGYKRVFLSGTTQCVSVPREVREILKSDKGDKIMVGFYYDKIPKENFEKTVKKKKVEKKVDEMSFFEKSEDNGLPLLDLGGSDGK